MTGVNQIDPSQELLVLVKKVNAINNLYFYINVYK